MLRTKNFNLFASTISSILFFAAKYLLTMANAVNYYGCRIYLLRNSFERTLSFSLALLSPSLGIEIVYPRVYPVNEQLRAHLDHARACLLHSFMQCQTLST